MSQPAGATLESVILPPDFDLIDLHAAQPSRYPFLLESVANKLSGHGGSPATFDILFGFPGATLRLDPDFRLQGAVDPAETSFLTALDHWWKQTGPLPGVAPPLPFHGGWFLFLGYELLCEVEPGIPVQSLPGVPVALATRIPIALVRDRASGCAWIVAEPGREEAINAMRSDLLNTGVRSHRRAVARRLVTDTLEPDAADFLEGVEKIRALIASGDVYQVNLARRWTAALVPEVSTADVYRQLRSTNPAPFAGIAGLDGWSVVSSSPERLVRCRDGVAETRPIAGTRPTAGDPAREEARRRDLLTHPKERAEHIMLIDLERNDLGRVCEPGSIEVNEFMTVESYAHVHHIVSNVRGRLRAGVSPGALIRAVFPGGTITGCPKVRCMEIINKLERTPRGPYSGSMGYLNRDGSCDLNILIRSFVVRDRELSFAAGSGIVADSIPAHELEETRAKAKGLLLALTG